MSLATVYCRAPIGVKAPLVNVEVHLANGLPAFNIVGLPETEVKESKDRVRAAIQNANFEFPAREEIDAAWAQEIGDYRSAYDRGQIGVTSVTD